MNRKRKVLRVWNDGQGFTSWRCARCDTTGWKRDGEIHHDVSTRPTTIQPTKSREELAQRLWAKSLPLRGSLAETYLRARQCFLDTISLRFLPAERHPHAMIGRFTSGAVHLTRLNADGTGKAGTATDKLMFGPVSGSPIVIGSPHPDTPLIICEGIEDGLSMALATEFSVWVAGSASMMPKLISDSRSRKVVYFAFDLDGAGVTAYRKALMQRSDIRSIRFPKQLDANTLIQSNGMSYLRELVLRRPTFHR